MDNGYIRAINIGTTHQFLGKSKAWMQDVMAEVGLNPAALDNLDMLIPFQGFCLLYEVLAHRTGRPSLAIEMNIATQPEFPQLGPLVALSNFVSTFEQFFEAGISYWHVHTNAYDLKLLRGDDQTPSILRCRARAFILPSRQFSEGVMTNLVGLARCTARQPELVPTLIRFQHARPADTRLHESYFRCPMEFDADRTELHFPTAFLDLPTNGRLALLRPLINYQVKWRIDRLPAYDQSASATAALTVPSLFGTGHCNIDQVAETMGLARKQLQRRLQDEGTTFSDILEKVRHELACQMLVGSEAPVAKIARLLDYASNPPFTLAFTRWTGMSPLAWRKKERARLGLT